MYDFCLEQLCTQSCYCILVSLYDCSNRVINIYRLVDKGHKVFGVEISEKAVSELFSDAGLSPKVTPIGNNSTLYEVHIAMCRIDLSCYSS